MKLIADSGSTKTTWALMALSGKMLKEVHTSGINPFFLEYQEIIDLMDSELLPNISEEILSIDFYGAGCGSPEKIMVVRNALKHRFPAAVCHVESDILGAARALFGNREGIACILGTGSNSCFYDGKDIIGNISSGGFILGDEGSGAVMGKKFAGDFIKGIIPSHLADLFLKVYKVDKHEIIDRVYRKSFPNRFLASFSKFVAENINDPYCKNLVYTNFINFIIRNVEQYPDYNRYSVGFVGSIAQVFEDILLEAMQKRGLKIHSIQKNPIYGLVEYHSSVIA